MRFWHGARRRRGYRFARCYPVGDRSWWPPGSARSISTPGRSVQILN